MQYHIKDFILKYKLPIIIIICLLINIILFSNYLIKLNTKKPKFKEIKPLTVFTGKINYYEPKKIKIQNINPSIISNKTIYLTFDDGPSYLTDTILDILKQENIPATFFVTSNQIFKYSNSIKRMYAENHTVALHTSTHKYNYIYASEQNYFNDLNTLRMQVSKITGHKPRIIRLPGGSSNTVSKKYNQGIITRITNKLTQNNFYYFDWNIDSKDASGKLSKEVIYQNVVNKIHNGSNIILMHDSSTKKTTTEALIPIIKYAKKNGYTFAKITKNTPSIHHHIKN